MLRANRLPAVRLCLPFLAALLSSAIVLAVSTDPSRAANAPLPDTGSSALVAHSASKQSSRRKSSSTQRAECAAAARTEKARKACAIKKAKGRAKKPSAPEAPLGPSLSPAFASPAVQGPAQVRVNGEASPTETPEPADPEGGGSPSKSPEGTGSSPVETSPTEPPLAETPPAETPPAKTPPVESPPVESPPAETSPVETPPETSPAETPLAGPPVEAPMVETSSVGKSSTTTTLASSANPSTVGQAVTYTATVSPAAATGAITFKEGGVAIPGCTKKAVTPGTATTCTTTYSVAGWHSIIAVYSGDNTYATSTSPTLTQVIHGDPVAVTLSSSLNPSTVGQAVTYTAMIDPATAAGTVEFTDSGSPIAGCTAQPVNSGSAKCATTFSAAGGPWIRAVYSGDSTYATSTSSYLTQTINKNASTVALASSANPSIVGQAVTYTATVGSAAATGAITFEEDGAAIPGCTKKAITPGTATTCTTTYSTVGWHLMVAVYSGDNTYFTSTSSTLTQVIHGDPPTVTLSASSNPSTVGQAVTYTATITGTVEFTSSGNPIPGCTAQIVSTGSAKCTTTFSAAGGPWIRAVYSGDSTYATSTSSYLTQTINTNVSAVALASSANPSIAGQAVTYTATVSPAAATGAITFKEDGITIPGCSKKAITPGAPTTCTTTYSATGWQSIIAVYSGDDTYATSTSPTLTQVIHGDPTTVTLSSSPNPSVVGQDVTYTAAVNPTTATGTVAFQEAGTALTGCSAQTINSGKATCSVASYANWGSYNVTATYGGASDYLGSTSSTMTQTVEPPPVGSTGPFRFFAPTSFWNEALPSEAPLDPNSAAIMGPFDQKIVDEEEAGKAPVAINTTSWSVPIYTVPADQATIKVKVTTENIWATPALQAAWNAVPLPANAQPAAGTDKHLLVWQPSTNRLWEFWQLEDTSEGWQAGWGGAMQNVSSDPGVYGSEAWPGAGTGWGASASSLSIAGGLITLEDLEKGVINHALAMGIPEVRGGVYASPAHRTDGTSSSSLSLPEGAHLRLDPSLDLAALHLPRVTLMIAEAAQRYGIVVRDHAATVSFYAQDPTPTGTNPYTGPHGYFEGKTPAQILASFPWSDLQLLKMELHSAS